MKIQFQVLVSFQRNHTSLIMEVNWPNSPHVGDEVCFWGSPLTFIVEHRKFQYYATEDPQDQLDNVLIINLETVKAGNQQAYDETVTKLLGEGFELGDWD